VHFYVLLIGLLMLVASVLVLRRSARLRIDTQANWSEGHFSASPEDDALFLGLGTRIFAPEDYELVRLETPRQVYRRFRADRTALALAWLDQVRGGISVLMRAHVKAARGNPNLQPADEVKLGFEFLVFRITIWLLYGAVWLRGPFHAAKLIGHCINLAGELKRMSADALPVVGSMAAEIMNGDSEAKQRPVAR
jgi:hypothetical protein